MNGQDTGRIEALEQQISQLAGLLAELAEGGRPPARTEKWRIRAFNPLAIVEPSQRRDAWWRLYDFVELMNSTFGAHRTASGTAPLYVQMGWWDNPLAVLHLAALCEAWVEASVTAGDPLAGSHDMLWLLLERVVPTLQLVCGPVTATAWGQRSDDVSFRLEPPSAMRASEDKRLARFEEFLTHDAPMEARTALTRQVLTELNAGG